MGKIQRGARVRTLLLSICERVLKVAAGVAVVRGPIGLRRHWAVAIAGFAEQMDLFIVCAELEIERALTEDLAFERLARGELDTFANHG
jgi:hypothetical protein